MIEEKDRRIIILMIEKTKRLIEIYSNNDDETIEKNYILSDAIQYEFEKLYEDSTRLSFELQIGHPELHINDLRSIRNRIAHRYESVSIKILLDTIQNDIPKLKADLENFISKEK